LATRNYTEWLGKSGNTAPLLTLWRH